MALIVGALLAVPATPALAANPDVAITNLPNGNLQAGQQTSMTFSVKNNNELPTAFSIAVSTFNGLSCQGECNIPARLIPPGEEASFTVNLVAGDVPAGQERSGRVRVSARAGGDQGGDERDMTVRGPNPPPTTQAPQTVRSISGKVVNQAGDGVANAYVLLKDSAGKQYETNTNSDGNFRFTGSNDRPIAPGRIDIGASSNSVREVVSFTANAGQSVTGQRITLAIQASNSPSPTPSASESAVPTEDPFDDEFAEDEETTPGEPAAPPAQASNEDSGGFGSWLLVLLGGLFVAVGVGTIVLLWMRRKENEDGEVDGDAPAAAPAGAVPAARGNFVSADDQTRVVNRVGTTPDPTMVAGAGISNAPTMMHQPVVDDVPPDPYAAPVQPYGAAGGAGQAWSGGRYGDEPAGYGTPGYGNTPSSGAGYGSTPSSGAGYGSTPSSGAGYGGRDYGAGGAGADYPPAGAGGGAGYGERYDEPTGRYTGDETRYPAPADPYATGLYEQGTGQGYGQSEPTGYGRGETGGYGRGEAGGYGQTEPTAGYGRTEPTSGYGQADQPGYGQAGSTGGYGSAEPDYSRGEPTGGYGSAATGGYGQSEPTGGYGQAGTAGGYTPSTTPTSYGQSEPTSYGQGEPTSYGQSEPTGYGRGEPAGGYGQVEPTGGYPAQPAGYGQPAEGYGQASGYDDAGRYGGYGQGGGYGQETPQQRGGYGSGYEQSGGYGPEQPPRQRESYDGGYEQGGGYGADPAQAGRARPEAGPGERGGRRLDWLDD
ncbi:carboxypeptidase regulatory-like domain-containing protein [Micromonospora sp. DT229]|uniref:carboxypeptidase-like regulatory domain-containing protein n=1 Tax=Micromonospora sp. DT229 TaxID=3393430 RepID=UPI003CF6DCE8